MDCCVYKNDKIEARFISDSLSKAAKEPMKVL